MNIFDRAVSLFEADYHAAAAWFTGEALPFLEAFFKSTLEEELIAIKPIAEAALAELGADVPAMLTGGLPAIATLGGQLLLSTALKLEEAGKTVALGSLHTAVAAVISNAAAALAAPAPAP